MDEVKVLIIRELQLYHFGKFHQMTLPLQPGINIIYGENEAGKSTIHRFIKAMLFGVTRLRGKGAANDDYSRFQPWEDARGYEGLMVFEHEGRRYRIYRNFYKEDERFNVYDDATGAEIILETGCIDEIVPGLTEANYRNTISIGQQESRLDDKFAASLQNYMVNMSMSHDGAVDIGRALNFLNEEEKKVKADMPIQQMEDLKKRMLYGSPAEDLKKHSEEIAVCQQQAADIAKEMDVYKEKMAGVRIRERQERMEGMQLLEQRKVVIHSLKREEDRASARNDVGLMGQWSFRIFILLTVLALGWMAVQWLMDLDAVIYKVSAGVLLAGALIAAARTSFKTPEDVIDVDSYKETLQSLQESLAPYIRKFGPQMDGPGYLDRMQKQLEQMAQEHNTVMKKLERLAWEKEQLDEKVIEADALKAAYESAAQENRRCKKELEAIAIAKMVISDLSGEIHQTFGKQMNEEVAEIFSEITGRERQAVLIDEKLNVRLDGIKQQIPLNRLSTGSIDQVYFALRLCSGALVFENGQMPLIMDDCFVFYDDKRLEKILEWLAAQKPAQIILFTCHHREAEVLQKMNIPYNYIHI